MGLIYTGSIYIYLDNARKKIDVENTLAKYMNEYSLSEKVKYDDIVKHINVYLDNLNYKQKYETEYVYKEAFKYAFTNILHDVVYDYILNNKIDVDKLKDNKSNLNMVGRNLSEAFNKIDSILDVNSNYQFTQVDLSNNIFNQDINLNLYLSNIEIDKNKLTEFLSSQALEFKTNLNQTNVTLRNKYLYEDAIIYKNILKMYKRTRVLSPEKLSIKKCLTKMRDSVVDSRILENIKEKEEYFNYIDKDIEANTLNLNDLDVYINSCNIIKSVVETNSLYYKDIVRQRIHESDLNNNFIKNLKNDLSINQLEDKNIEIEEVAHKEELAKK